MEKQANICLSCLYPKWINNEAQISIMPKKKRIEFHRELARFFRTHGVDLKRQVFPFIYCPKWKKEKLYPYTNPVLKCKYYKGVKDGKT